VKSFTQLTNFLRRMKTETYLWDRLDEFYPFYVERGQTVTLSDGRKLRFKEERVFEDIKQLSNYVIIGGKKTLDLGDEENDDDDTD
jgi:hypothetical protein